MATSMYWLHTLVVVAAVIAAASAHPTKYKRMTNESCTDPRPPINSYHIHVLFWPNNNASIDAALLLRKQFEMKFNPGPPCQGLFHQPDLCMFDTEFGPDGPFLVPQWAAFIPPADFETTVPWIMQNRGDLDVLVHPNTGCEVWDHVEWSVWGGTKWEIDYTVFSHNDPYPWTPTAEEDEY